MGDQVYSLRRGEEYPVEPIGVLASSGWLPGTWVTFSSQPLSFIKAFTTVTRSDGAGVLAGFLKTGPQHVSPIEGLGDMWRTDTIQRDDGDSHANWGPADAGGSFELDDNLQLQRMGSRVATLVIPPSGYHKFYVFETEDLAERTVSGAGGLLSYTPGDLLYVSNRGRLTSEQESLSHSWTGYVVGLFSSDLEGSFLYAVAAMTGSP